MSEQEQYKQLAREFLSAITNKDKAALDRIFSEDVEYILPGCCFLSGSYDKPTILMAMDGLYAMLEDSITFDILSMTCEDGRVSCMAQGKAKTIHGDDYNNFYHFMFHIRNGEIFRGYECVDTLLVENALKPAAKTGCPELLKMISAA